MKETILEVKNLSKHFKAGKEEFVAVDDVSFRLLAGESLGIVGESGSGKSTIARMITRLLEPDTGQIFFQGKDITKAKGQELRQIYQSMQMVFQSPAESFDPRRTLGDGIGEGLKNMGIKKAERTAAVEKLLIRCGLEPSMAKRYPHQVSGGQCQRAAIARALSVNPRLLICDEATSALDVTVQKKILELLMELRAKENLSFLMISHDLGLVQAFCQRVIIVYQGKTVESGAVDEVMKHPREAYTKKLISSVL